MALDPQLLEILRVPGHAPRAARPTTRRAQTLTCTECGRVFEVRDGIPVLLLDEAAARPPAARGSLMDGPLRRHAPACAASGIADEALLDDADGDRRPTTRAACCGRTASAGAQVRESAALAAEAEPRRAGRRGPPARRRRRRRRHRRPAPATCWPPSPARAARCRCIVAPQRRRARLGRRRRRGDRGVGVAAAARRRSAAAEAAARRGARLVAIGAPDSRAAGGGRAGPGAVHPGAPAGAGPGQPVGADRAGAAGRPHASAWSRSTRPTWPRPRPGWTPTPSAAGPAPSRSSTRPRRWRSTWPARSRSCGARRRWPRSPPAGSPTRSPPTPATRSWPARWARPAGAGSACSTACSAALAESDAGHLRRPGRRATTDATRLRLVLLRDGGLNAEDDADEPVAVEERRADAVQTLAERRGVRCGVLTAEGGSALERLASLVAVPDFASHLPCARPRPGPDGRAGRSPR